MIKKMTLIAITLGLSLAAPAQAAKTANKKARKAETHDTHATVSVHDEGHHDDGDFRITLGTTGLDLSSATSLTLTFFDITADAGYILPNGLEFGLLFGVKSISSGGTISRVSILPEASFNFGSDDFKDSFYTRLGLGVVITSLGVSDTGFALRPCFGKKFGLSKHFSWSPEIGFGLYFQKETVINFQIIPVQLSVLL